LQRAKRDADFRRNVLCACCETGDRNGDRLIGPNILALGGELLDPCHIFSAVTISTLNEVLLDGPEPYQLTANLWGAAAAAAGGMHGTGALGPANAFGLDHSRPPAPSWGCAAATRARRCTR
jgi:hypothetical protein